MTVLSRALLTLEGTLRTIDPSFNIAHEATALLPELAGQKQDDAAGAAGEGGRPRACRRCARCPANIEGIATQLRSGRLSMRVERYAGNDREVVDAWIDRVIFAAIGIIGLLASALFLVAAAVVGKSDDDFQSTLQVFGFFGIIVTSVIQMRVVAQMLRRESDDRAAGASDGHELQVVLALHVGERTPAGEDREPERAEAEQEHRRHRDRRSACPPRPGPR